jgi:Ca2+-binding RTX toxin-like protein
LRAGSATTGPSWTGRSASNLINGFGGDDLLLGNFGNDALNGDDGKDSLFGNEGNDSLDGGLDNLGDSDRLAGGTGIDTATYAQVQHGISVNLIQGQMLGAGNVDTLVSIENVTATNFNDSVVGDFGNNGIQGADGNDFIDGLSGNDFLSDGSGNDVIKGGAGIDQLIGSSGADKLTGGTEADTFRYFNTADSGVGSVSRDVIADFVHGQDKIDLESVDARVGTVGNQTFSFVGSAAFSAEGQVRVVTDGDHMLVQMNTSGTSGADSVIELTGNINVTATDFTL